jgi:PAS domain S-box-containing protein
MRFNELDSFMHDQMDFVPRERRNHIWRVIIAFSLTIVLVFVSGYTPLFNKMEVYTPLIAIVLVAILCMYVVYRKQISLDLVMSTEYQNMLFAQALSVGSSFCLIVRRDGTILHASEGMGTVFPQFDYAQSKALEGVFEQGMVRKNDRERIMSAIYASTQDRLIFSIVSQYEAKKDYIITVEPLPRPSGFSVVRGREYLGQRSGLQLMPDALSATSVDKLDHMLATTNIAHYTTDHFGRIEYANPAFERVFGYSPGTMVERKLSLHHIIFSMGSTLLTEEYSLHDFVGEAVLLNQQGTRLKGMIQQSILRDDAGKVIGATGTIIAAAG